MSKLWYIFFGTVGSGELEIEDTNLSATFTGTVSSGKLLDEGNDVAAGAGGEIDIKLFLFFFFHFSFLNSSNIFSLFFIGFDSCWFYYFLMVIDLDNREIIANYPWSLF